MDRVSGQQSGRHGGLPKVYRFEAPAVERLSGDTLPPAEKRHLPDPGNDDAVANIEIGNRPLRSQRGLVLREAVVIGLNGGEEIGCIVNRLRPGVRSLEL